MRKMIHGDSKTTSAKRQVRGRRKEKTIPEKLLVVGRGKTEKSPPLPPRKGSKPNAGHAESIRRAKRAGHTAHKLGKMDVIREIVESTNAILLQVTAKGEVVFVNDAACQAIGVKREEVLGKVYLRYVHPDDRRQIGDYFLAAVRGKVGLTSLEFRFLDPLGNTRWVSFLASPVFDKGHIVGVSGTGQDVTRRKRIEEELRESEGRYRLLTENTSDLICELDGQARYMFVNANFAKVLGYRPEELLGRSAFDFVHRDDLSDLAKRFRRIFDGGGKESVELRVTEKSGAWRRFEVVGNRFIRENGEIRIALVGRDITERKQTEEALLIRDMALRSSINGIAIADLAGALTYVNQSFINMWGFDTETEVVGRPVLDLWVDKSNTPKIMEAMATTGMWLGEAVARRKDGTAFDVQLAANIVLNSDQKPICMMASVLDVTERKRAEEAVLRSSELMRGMFETISDGITFTDLQGKITDLNDAALRMHGYESKGDILSKPALDLIAQKDHVRSMANMEKTVATGRSGVLEYKFRRQNGEEFDGELSAALLKDREGNPAGFVALTRDVSDRKGVEHALRSSEERLRQGQEIAQFGNWEFDLRTGKVWASEEAFRIYGIERTTSELPLQTVQECVVPDYRPALDEALRNLVAGKGEYNVEYQIRRVCDAELRFVHSKAGLLAGVDGKPAKVMGVIQDITDRKRSEDALKKSEGRLRLITDNTRDLVRQIDPQGVIQYVSPSHKIVLGYEVDEMLGKNVYEFLHPEDAERVKTLMRQGADMAKGGKTEMRFRHRDGHYLWLESVGTPLLQADGLVKGAVFSARDITERKRAEEELRAAHQTLSMFFEKIPVAIVAFDPQDRVLEWNPAAESIFGWSKDEIVGRSYPVTPPGKEKEVQELLRLLSTEGSFANVEAARLRKDGSLVDVSISAIQLPGSKETSARTVVMFTDISARKRGEERLARLRQCLLSFGPDPIANVNRLVALCGEQLQATCALYNRLEEGMLCSLGQWHTPPDYAAKDKPEGHICYDVIRENGPTVRLIKDLPTTSYALTDPNVLRYNLKTYLGAQVAFGGKAVGSLCVVYQNDRSFLEDDLKFLEIVASAIGVEEERRKAEGQVQASLREKEVLLKEIHHRVKNNLQVISSLLNIQAKYVKDADAVRLFGESQNRVKSMALIHEHLYRSKNLAVIDMREYIRELAHQLFRSYGGSARGITLDMNIGEVTLGVDKAIPCGIILTELVSNALKYAFPDGRAGSVRITLENNGREEIALTVQDDGVGVPDGLVVGKTDSLGLTLVTMLSEQIHGTMEIVRPGNGVPVNAGAQFRVAFAIAPTA